MRGAALAGCLALSGPAVLSYADAKDLPGVIDPPELSPGDLGQHLAVIVPVYRGDLSRAVSSLGRWPSTCSPLTESNADLVLYYAEGEEDAPAVTAAVETISETAGSCFANTRLVYAHLSEEEDVYPKGPSVMFFKMFLDEGVHADLSEYDALAIVEWDVLVASDRSFEELHHAAFRGNEDFWVKGSNLGGTNFHSTAQASEMWNVLGHINGNAIYNNNDPAFVEYVDYTRTRWEYTYPYDVALWLTISDFPYSWPLWQRYSSKFVTTNLISYVGYEHVDHNTVSDAVAGQTLFIHGSMVDEGNLESLKATRKATATGRRLSADSAVCLTACGSEDVAGLPVGTSTVCDDTCTGDSSARFGGFLCGAGDSERFGSMCRLCYVDVEEARKQEQSLALERSSVEGEQVASHVIMCDTLRPPEASDCSDKCGLKKDTVCDESCGSGRYGDYNCNWRDHGPKCRFCFDDLKTALLADNVAQRRGGRVVMCSTFEPPQAAEVVPVGSRTKTSRARKLQPWRDNEKWKGDPDNDEVPKWQREDEDGQLPRWQREEKWKDPPPADEIPKWRREEKWKNDFCDVDDCPIEDSNGMTGRVCDESCQDGVPYGTLGCGASVGAFGDWCRVCYLDQDAAFAADSATERAIMCATVLPVEGGVYRRLTATTVPEGESASNVAENLKSWKRSHAVGAKSKGKRHRRKLQPWRDNEKWKGDPDNDEVPKWQREDEDGQLPRWQREEKWKDPPPADEIPKWRREEKWKNDFCDVDDCPIEDSNGITGRVCDESCQDGVPYGTLGCGASVGAFGDWCRVCYLDQDAAFAADSATERAIMCATVLPVEGGVYRRLTATTVPEGESASNVAENLKSWKRSHAVGAKSKGKRHRRKLQPWRDNEKWKGDPDNDEVPKWQREDEDGQLPRWQREEKWKDPPPADEIPKWRREEKWKNDFCDVDDCPIEDSNGITGRVCDESCQDGVPYGTLGCGASVGAFGDWCRVCYLDQDTALAADSATERAIMCATVLPVEGGVYRRLTATTVPEGESASNVAENLKSWKRSHAVGAKSKGKRHRRKLQPWRDNEKWKGDPDNDEVPKWQREDEDGQLPRWQREEKWKDPPPADEIPKWRREEKWKNDFCDVDDCPIEDSNGITGRVCDESCQDGVPYGTLGCGASVGAYGDWCRVCYLDQDAAFAADSATERAIMCATVLPVEGGVYRRLTATTVPEGESASNVADNLKSWKRSHAGGAKSKGKRHRRKLQPWRDNEKWKGDPDNDEVPKWQREDEDGQLPRWQREEKWKDPPPADEIPKWRREEKWKNDFCDVDDCPIEDSNGMTGRVCDESCQDGVPYGTLGCGASVGAFGDWCRVCYLDQDAAFAADSATERAIMCATVLPVEGGVYRRLTATTVPEGERASNVAENLKSWKRSHAGGAKSKGKRHRRKLQPWRDNEKWKGDPDNDEVPKWQREDEDGQLPRWQREEKWKDPPPADEIPKWRREEKWKNDFCDVDDCPIEDSNGITGRVCDESCQDGVPYGTLGCGASVGAFGDWCRVCYLDEDAAFAADSATERAIMCGTVLPVEGGVYRRLTATTVSEGESASDALSMFSEASALPYVNDLVRGNLCAFIAGSLNEVDQVEPAVMSVLQFLPGMRVAVAADNAAFDSYNRAVGTLPGVTVHRTKDIFTASLFADHFCGVDTSLILYMKPGSIVSRQFMSKDTHSTHGDLLVVHGNARSGTVDRALAKQTAAVLGFESPSFTFNTDLFLPVGANAELREFLMSGEEQGDVLKGMTRDMSAVPQLMAALAYSRNTPRVWFIDPQTWVSQHLFRTASIWEIPLVKPHYTCSIDPSVMKLNAANIDVGDILQSNLDFFTHGGTCDNGFIDVRR